MLKLSIEMSATERPEIPETLFVESEMPVTEKELEASDKAEKTVVRRGDRFQEGFDAGFTAAAEDFANDEVDLEALEEKRDITDFFAVGFEVGYLRKLAEVLVF